MSTNVNVADKKIVLCNCACPNWGKEHDDIWECQCDCGARMNVCGLCLQKGRVVDCGGSQHEGGVSGMELVH
jgi:hypothetical protein